MKKLTLSQNSEKFDPTICWQVDTDRTVSIGTPVLSHGIGFQKRFLSVDFVEHAVSDTDLSVEYRVSFKRDTHTLEGRYRISCQAIQEGDSHRLMIQTHYAFEQPVFLDLILDHSIVIHGPEACKDLVLPERGGHLRRYDVDAGPWGFFDIGRAVKRSGSELAVPTVGMNFDTFAFAISSDPYMGIAYHAERHSSEKGEGVKLVLHNEFPGESVPFHSEKRTLCLQLHARKNPDVLLENFYYTIPEIEAGPPWIHNIKINFYDYIADAGEALEKDLEALAKRIPAAKRKHVIVCLHGYYDYLGRYSYNHSKGAFDEEWLAYDNHQRCLPMTRDALHDRMKLVKSHGFRVGIYFADALAYDRLNPDFREDWLLRDEAGDAVNWFYWQQRPDKKDELENFLLDPSNPEVQEWFLGYTRAYIKAFGRDLDALVWDETQCVVQSQVAKSDNGKASIDRAMMKLVASVAIEIQKHRSEHPDLALLVSDIIDFDLYTKPGHLPNCLVAHGTWQDSACDPKGWAPALIPNFRNCVISCNWEPVTNRDRNRIACDQFGLPQGVSNGYGDEQGPANMPPEILDEIVDRFLKLCDKGRDRVRYLQDG